jgi:hypothetical protein
MESKCAYLFDKLGWKWQYEPFSVMLDGINYTPDFYIPDRRYVIECRGYESELGNRQIEEFGKSLEILDIPGFPMRNFGVIGPHESVIWKNTDREKPMGLARCLTCGSWFYKDDWIGRRYHTCSRYGPWLHDYDFLVSVKDGDILFCGHSSDEWDRCQWALWHLRSVYISDCRKAAAAILDYASPISDSRYEYVAELFRKSRIERNDDGLVYLDFEITEPFFEEDIERFVLAATCLAGLPDEWILIRREEVR